MSDNHSHHIIVPVKYYVATFAALLFLTFITVWITRFDFGAFNIYIAMLVAAIKASLVLLIFMALAWDKGFNRIAVVFALIFFGIFIAFTLADVATRGSVEELEAGKHNINSPVKPLSESSKYNKGH
jgi:cytochrome c oxidase subunit 4